MATDSKTTTCDSCGYDTACTEHKAPIGSLGITAWFCALCVASQAGNAYQCQQHPRDHLRTMRVVCYVGNAVIAEMRRLAEVKDGN
jgi:hypothetical protein